MKQSPFIIFTLDLNTMKTSYGLGSLKQNFQMILLNANKQLVKADDLDENFLSEKYSSPYLIIVPHLHSQNLLIS